ncbi:MAG: hypothetical protein C4541_02890 [Candidatus Auribacter fodinae]|jgi:hypothetical protein|uniref:PKD domain-containing protein n=1 Tax=Candidatus Auribacter fodinae TaxID=2093366 RepID=A0A3A4R4J4_9BACT|nr:MAG: hypothetical protein C4541_02890 [Candidatus Auribacter fodinae]
MQPSWNFSTRNGIVDENGSLLPGRPNPYVPGAIVQLIQTQDDVISPPDENGNPTGDDTLYLGMTFYIGQNIPPFHPKPTGSFTYTFQPMPQGKLYARIFNKAAIADSTYYGQTSIITANQVLNSGGLVYYFYVDDYGLTQTNILFREPSAQAPVAHAGGPYSGSEGHAITFNASMSYDPDNSGILSYLWDMDNDGEFDDASGITPAYTWTGETTTIVRVQVTDNDGLTGAAEAMVKVYNSAPVVMNIGAQSVNEGDTLVFEAVFSDDGVDDTHAIHINWDNGHTSYFGFDDHVASPYEVSFLCMDAGLYNPVVTVYDNDGGASYVTFSLNVAAQPLNTSITLLPPTAIALVWDAVPDKEYDLYFCDEAASIIWQKIGSVTGNAFTDHGDNDGFDNIPGTPDDRSAPSESTARLYKVIPRKFY